jgi:hypothetical protein
VRDSQGISWKGEPSEFLVFVGKFLDPDVRHRRTLARISSS